jgi:hypothetical protein
MAWAFSFGPRLPHIRHDMHVYDHFEVRWRIPATCFMEQNRCKL